MGSCDKRVTQKASLNEYPHTPPTMYHFYLVTANGDTATHGTSKYFAMNHPSHAKRLKTMASAPRQALKLPCISMILSCCWPLEKPLPLHTWSCSTKNVILMKQVVSLLFWFQSLKNCFVKLRASNPATNPGYKLINILILIYQLKVSFSLGILRHLKHTYAVKIRKIQFLVYTHLYITILNTTRP